MNAPCDMCSEQPAVDEGLCADCRNWVTEGDLDLDRYEKLRD